MPYSGFQKFLAEFIGTAFLVCTIKCSVGWNQDGFAPIAIGFSLVVSIFSYGYISGGHFNPCVTTGVIIRQWKGIETFNSYIFHFIGQFLGGLAGGGMGWLAGGNRAGLVYARCDDDHIRQAFFSEFFYTFLLVTVVLHCACDSRQLRNSFYGLAIGTTVMLGIFASAGTSGGVFNVAVYVGLLAIAKITAYTLDEETVKAFHFWVYLVAEMLGGIVAGLIYRFAFYSVEADAPVGGTKTVKASVGDESVDVDEEV